MSAVDTPVSGQRFVNGFSRQARAVLLCLLAAGIAWQIPGTADIARPLLPPPGVEVAPSDGDIPSSDWSGILAAHTAWQHRVQETGQGWAARNPGQQWVTRFDGQAFMTTPVEGGWQWGLRLVSVGRGTHGRTLNRPKGVTTDGTRVQYQWDRSLTEWWVNDTRGLEHGFSLAERPAGAAGEPLDFTLATQGGLQPRIDEAHEGLTFVDRAGTPLVTYGHLQVWDADRRAVPAQFVETGTADVVVRVDDAQARYPLTVDPLAQQAYLKAPASSVAGDWIEFGFSVAVDGDTAVVSAPSDSSSTTGVNSVADENAAGSGAAYVFVRNGTSWTQQAYLKPAQVGTTQAGDFFGRAVAISGDTIVVSAPSEDSSSTGVNSTPDEAASNAGAAYVFVRSGTTWTQQAYLKPSQVGTTQAGDAFGWSVAIDGDLVAVGSRHERSSTTGVNSTPDELASSAGAAYVFARVGGVWSQEAYLKPQAVGTTQANDQFGQVLDLSGQTLVVGAFLEDSSSTGVGSVPDESSTNAGAAYVFVRNAGNWTQQAYLKPTDVGTTQAGDGFGVNVAIDGDLLAVSARSEDSSGAGPGAARDELATDSGAVYVFRRSGSAWTQEVFLKASNPGAGDWFGDKVDVRGQRVAVGATKEDSATTGVNGSPDEGTIDSGAAYVFNGTSGAWVQEAYVKPAAVGTSQEVDEFGFALALTSDTLLVGAHLEDGSIDGVNGAIDERAMNAGAVYAFRLDTGSGVWAQEAYVKPVLPPQDGRREDRLGHGARGVSLSGDTLAVGIPFNDTAALGVNPVMDSGASDAGAVVIFVRTGPVWTQQAVLRPARVGTAQASDYFGVSVALDGDTLVVGAPNEDSSVAGMDGTASGVPNESSANAGAVYVFTRSGTTWSQQAYLKAFSIGTTTSGDLFGTAVAVSGDTLVVGAPSEDSNSTGINSTATETASGAGAAYVFVRSGGAWTPEAYVKPGAVGSTQASDAFGTSVAIAGNTVVVGAPNEDSSTTGVGATPNESSGNSGAAYVFVRSGTSWTQEAFLKPAAVGTTQASDVFGSAVAISGDTVVVGAPGEDGSATTVNGAVTETWSGAGAAYVFIRSGGTWTQQAYVKPATVGTTAAGDALGSSVAIDGDDMVIGAAAEDSSSLLAGAADEVALSAGAVFRFQRTGSAWSQSDYLKPAAVGTSSAGDQFGQAVTVSAGTVVASAPFEDGGATGAHGQVDDLGGNVGAAFVFAAPVVPVVTTPTSAAVTATGATLGGTVSVDGGAAIIARGVVYAVTSASGDPILGAPGVVEVPAGTVATGVFSVPVAGLTSGATYSFRAYATNGVGTSYSTTAMFSTPSTVATLSALALSAGTLSPAFASGTTSYAATVPNATASVTVTPTVTQAGATLQVRVGGGAYTTVTSGTASGALTLAVGGNILDIFVTAQDGVATQFYTVTVTRTSALTELSQYDGTQPAPDASLYADAGVTGVTAGNVAAANSVLAVLSAGATDTVGEIQSIVDAYVAVLMQAAGTGTVILAHLTALGVTGATADLLPAIRTALAATADDGSGVDTLSELQTVVTTAVTSATTALTTLSAYDGTNTMPTTATYATAGVSDVTMGNLGAMNSALAVLSAQATDTVAEVQAVIDAYRLILAEANGPTPDVTPASHPTTGLYAVIGATTAAGLTVPGLSLLNEVVGERVSTAVDTVQELEALAAAVHRVMLTAAGTLTTPALSVADFDALGIIRVTADNLSRARDAILATLDDGREIDSLFKLQAVVNVAAEPVAQSIRFEAIAPQFAGGPPVLLVVSASSGLPVVLSSLTPSVCTVSGVQLTLVAAGTCTVQATQGGNGQWAPASVSTQDIVVDAPSVSLARATTVINPEGGEGAVTVSVSPATVSWQAVSSAAWLSTTSSGVGSGTVRFLAAANAATTSRSATITVGGQVHTVTQAGLIRTRLRVGEVLGSRVRLDWTYEGPATAGFVVEGDIVPAGQQYVLAVGTVTMQTFENVGPGRYYARVRPVEDPAGMSASNEVEIAVGQPDVPAAPVELFGVLASNRVTLHWTNAFTGGDPADVELQVTGAWVGTLPLGLTDTVVFDDVPPGAYAVEVVARNAVGRSAPSNRVLLNVPAGCVAPQAPTWVTHGMRGRTVTVRWQPSAEGGAPTDYWVTADGVGTVSTAGATSVQGTLAPGTYRVSVQAVNACGISPASQVQTIVVP